MNDFKYQNKPEVPDKVITDFKDFGQVLEKRNAIAKSYSKVKKWTISASIFTAITVGVIIGLNIKERENPVIKNQDPITLAGSFNAQPVLASIKTKQPEVKVIEEKNKLDVFVNQTAKQNTEEEIVVQKETKSKGDIFAKQEDTLINKKPEQEANNWFTLSEIPLNKRPSLPTLYVSKLAWPNSLPKKDLVRFPNIDAIYTNLNRQVPIVDGMVYVTNELETTKPKGFRITGNTFPPGLIRDIHKAKNNSILLIKDLILFIPGMGRVSIGDKKIDITQAQNQNKN